MKITEPAGKFCYNIKWNCSRTKAE